MRKTLVPTDFSESSMSAFMFALDIAERSGGTVDLLHIISLPVLHDTPLMPVEGLRKPLVDDLKEASYQKLEKMIANFNASNIPIKCSVAVSNHIHDTILQTIIKEGVELVVMGTKGVSGIREMFFGSNTERIVRTSPVPVLAVKQHTRGTAIRNIVFPNTLDVEGQEALVMKVKALQNFFQAHLHIIWINTPVLHKVQSEARLQLTNFAKRYMLTNYTVNVFSYSDEETGILEFTKQINGDMIAMGTHGRSGIAHLLSGSIAEDVVNHVAFPVWTFCSKSALSLTTQN